MDKLTAIKIKYDDGTYSDEIPVSVLSENVEWDNTHTLVDVLGSIDVDVTGTIQDQISQLFNEKVSNSDMQSYITSSMPTYITNWLNTNVNPVGSAVVVDSSLTIAGAAADAKKVGDALAPIQEINDLKKDLRDIEKDVLNIPLNESKSGDAVASLNIITIMQDVQLKANHTYNYAVNLVSASELPVYVHIRDDSDAILSSISLAAGSTSASKTYIPNADVTATITLADVNRAVSYTVTIQDADQNSVIDSIQENVLKNTDDITALQEAINIYIPILAEGTTLPISGQQTLLSPVKIISGHSYKLDIKLSSGVANTIYFYINNSEGTMLASVNINGGVTTATKIYNSTTDDDSAYISVNTIGQSVNYAIELTDMTADNRNYIKQLQDDVTELTDFTGYEADSLTFTDNAYISTPSVGHTKIDFTPEKLNNCSCLSAACEKGDTFTISGTPKDNSGTRAYAWFDENGICLYREDSAKVLDNLELVAPVDGTLVVNFMRTSEHSAFKGVRNLHSVVISNKKRILANEEDILKLITSPIETLPTYIRDDMAYRPLGQLQHSYLCLTCDDGTAGLESYTIPMLAQKNVPCTFGLWATSSREGATRRYTPSVILQSQSGIQAVKDAVTNFGCSVAQHGYINWTDLTEEELNDFFDREKEAFMDLGITISGAICPSHCVDNRVRAIVGGRFHSVRAGYNGFLTTEDQINKVAGDVFTPYGIYTGARSNCYSYTSFNIIDVDKPIEKLQQILQTAIANNYVMIVYWHDWNFIDTDDNYLANRERLEAFIDYAKTTSITFCTLGEIPTLY